MSLEIRLRFNEDEAITKSNLEELAQILEMSVNQLGIKILSAQFNEKDRIYVQLLQDLAEFKKSNQSFDVDV